MVTGRLGWVTASLGVAAGSSGMAIFRTTNGGARWWLTELTDYNRHTPGAIPFGCDKSNAVFSGASTGWVAGSCPGGRAPLWVSRDGGYGAPRRTADLHTVPPPSRDLTRPVRRV